MKLWTYLVLFGVLTTVGLACGGAEPTPTLTPAPTLVPSPTPETPVATPTTGPTSAQDTVPAPTSPPDAAPAPGTGLARIAFARAARVGLDPYQIYVMDADGSNETSLTSEHGEAPAWSPMAPELPFNQTEMAMTRSM